MIITALGTFELVQRFLCHIRGLFSDGNMSRRNDRGIFGDLYYKRHIEPSMGQSSSVPKVAKTVEKMAVHGVNVCKKFHIKARCDNYPRGGPARFKVPDEKVPWDVPFEDYKPEEFQSKSVLDKPVWADPNLLANEESNIKWNQIDGKVNRKSFEGEYKIVDGLPRNPRGRTGVKGRGALGRWGPNHAADPIVTRWKRDEKDNIVTDSNGRNVLQFVSVQRRDNGQWALPGGMVDVGEHVSLTLKREFGEEAMNSLEMSPEEKQEMEQKINELFKKGTEIYAGYVDDPRNTDNSWMETVAYNFHDPSGKSVGKIRLHAGDDAAAVRWTDLSSDIELYASHIDFIEKVAVLLGASWDR